MRRAIQIEVKVRKVGGRAVSRLGGWGSQPVDTLAN